MTRKTWILVVVAAWIGGCVGDAEDVGDPDDGTYAANCEYRPSLLPSLDAVALVGASASEVLARAEGNYAGDLSWNGSVASHANNGNTTPVDIEIVYAGGEIRDVDAVLLQPCEHLGPCPCEDQLEIDVNVRIVSADGALDEQMVVALLYSPTNDYFGSPLPHFYHGFDPDAAPGGLASSDIAMPEGATLRELFLTAEIDAGTCTGSLNAEIDMDGGIGAGPFASFTAITDAPD
jgi:hypothetical protein